MEHIITSYKKMEMELISDLAGDIFSELDEVEFYDLGYVQSQISRLQKQLKEIKKDIKLHLQDNKRIDYVDELLHRREQLVFYMIFWASNSFKNLKDCELLAEGYHFPFMKCIEALKQYDAGEKEQAYRILEEYISVYGIVEKHFLVNKVFGVLLLEKKKYQKAVCFLSEALQYIPDDKDCLKAIESCYEQLNEIDKSQIIREIRMVLEK